MKGIAEYGATYIEDNGAGYAIYVSTPILACLTMRHGGGGKAGEGETAV